MVEEGHSNGDSEIAVAPPLKEEAAADKDEAKNNAKEAKEEEKKLTKEEEDALREKYKDWPLKNISEIHDNDVLYGRGGGTNHHPGNKRYRKMVEDRKVDYVNSKRLDKPLVALDIIRQWRGQLPPGRFLKLDEKTKLYHDVGDKKAREKTSQALREKAPQIRKQQEEERSAKERPEFGEPEDDPNASGKSTRFAEGTNENDGGREDGISKAVLARDHSLGVEYLNPDEAVNLDGFSWQDPFRSGQGDGRASSQGSLGSMPTGRYPSGGGPSPHPGYRYPSHGSMGPPPPPAFMTSGEERHFRYSTSGRYESWGSVGSAPPPMPGFGPPQHSGGWNREASANSLGQNPLPHASIGHPAPYPFDGRSHSGHSGHWGPPHGYPHPPYPYPGLPPPGAYPPPGREYSGGPPPGGAAHPGAPPPPHHYRSPNSGATSPTSPPSPRYEVDPVVASNWSNQNQEGIAKSWSGSSDDVAAAAAAAADRPKIATPDAPKASTGTMPKPDVVKRATSNQNETLETKPDLRGPSVKRAALNRDSSATANRLKEQYLPNYMATGDKFDRDMRTLSRNLEESTLEGQDALPSAKPTALTDTDRSSTLDFAMDLMVKPEALTLSERTSTLDALALALDEEPLVKPEADAGLAEFAEEKPALGRPTPLTLNDRLTTTDIMDMVLEPIPDDDAALVSGKRQVV